MISEFQKFKVKEEAKALAKAKKDIELAKLKFQEKKFGTQLKGTQSNIKLIQRNPTTNLTKEQRMLNALFNDKNQLWGNGEPVTINNVLTSGNGLIKTGSGDTTRRLFLP